MKTLAEYETEIAAITAVPDLCCADFAWDNCMACDTDRHAEAWLAFFRAARESIMWIDDAADLLATGPRSAGESRGGTHGTVFAPIVTT